MKRFTTRWTAPVLGIVACAALIGDGAEPPESRRPIAIGLSGDYASAWIANQSGSVIRLAIADGRIEREIPLGGRLTDLVLDPAGQWFAVTDAAAHELVIQRTTEGAMPRRIPVASHPVACAVSADGNRIAVTSLWSRTVTWIEAARLLQGDEPGARTMSLPFAPRKCLWLPDGRSLLVADAFSGRMCVIDTVTATLASVREIPGHNIAGLTIDPRGTRVYLTHQIIHRGSQTSRDGVHWGGVLTNVVRSLAVTDLLDPRADILAHNRTDYVGDIGRGAGDPAGLAVRADGWRAVAFAGVNEIGFDSGDGLDWKRITVGQRPTALALTSNQERVVVANTLDDSVSIISVAAAEVEHTVRLSPARSLTAAERGERLFYDARLSHDGWFSCHSCHTDGHSNRQLVDNFTDGTEGTPKRVLSLLGVRDTAPYAWDGHIADLATQVQHSVVSTMQGRTIDDSQVTDLVAYLNTLEPPPALATVNHSLRDRGRHVFTAQGCLRCHAGDAFTSAESYDVGLSDEQGLRRFNPPSLRGVGHGGPYFHDGRYNQIKEVFTRQRHEVVAPLSAEDLAALVAFLEGL